MRSLVATAALLCPRAHSRMMRARKPRDREVRGCGSNCRKVSFCSGLTTNSRFLGRPRGFGMIHDNPVTLLFKLFMTHSTSPEHSTRWRIHSNVACSLGNRIVHLVRARYVRGYGAPGHWSTICILHYLVCIAASSITAATSFGREIYTQWLAPATSTIWLFARVPYHRSKSGLMVRSAPATSAQLGLLLQAGAVMTVLKL